jgi:tetratricopeptide (TPR) repeat protein
MSRTLSTIFIVIVFGVLQAQQPSVPSQPTAISVHVSEGPGARFKFTKVDYNLLAEADAIDAEYEKRDLVLHDPGVQAYIDSIGNRVLGGRPVPEKVTWRFHVFRTPEVNAYSWPNGSVYMTTGLLALLENDAQLAAVLAHETAHIYERHSYLENRSVRKKAIASEIIAAASVWVPGGYALLAATAAADIGTRLMLESVYGYSREVESQADRDGIAAMTVAGYNPHAAAVGFELLDQATNLEYIAHPTFYQDHPKLTERREKALAFADAHTPMGAQTGLKEDYIRAVAPAIASSIDTDIENRRPRTAVATATRLADTFPGDPHYQLLLGDSYRTLGAETAVATPDEFTASGEDRRRNQALKMSAQEEQKALLKTPRGQTTLKENQGKAEKAFLAAIGSNPQYALAYRELGFLYQDESRFADAATNYRHYLQLVADTSLDRLRIARRLTEVEKLQTGPPH